MAYTGLTNTTEFGIREFFNYPNLDSSNIFWPLMLFVFFFVYTTRAYYRELEREGRANILPFLAIGGYVTTSLAVVLSLLGVVSNAILITTLVISLVFQAIYLLTK